MQRPRSLAAHWAVAQAAAVCSRSAALPPMRGAAAAVANPHRRASSSLSHQRQQQHQQQQQQQRWAVQRMKWGSRWTWVSGPAYLPARPPATAGSGSPAFSPALGSACACAALPPWATWRCCHWPCPPLSLVPACLCGLAWRAPPLQTPRWRSGGRRWRRATGRPPGMCLRRPTPWTRRTSPRWRSCR